MTATLVIPVLNELQGLRAVMPYVPRMPTLVVDGWSTDGSYEWCQAHGYPIYRQKRPGLRAGLIETWALIDSEIMVTFSPDGNSDPARIGPLLAAMERERADMGIVSRYLEGAHSEDDTPLTRMGNRLFTGLINRLFGGRYTDALVLFRAYRTDLPERLGLLAWRNRLWERVIGRRISWEPMLSIRAANAGCHVIEIPGDEWPRIGHGRGGLLLPESRIEHVRAGLAMAYLICEERLRSPVAWGKT